MESMQVNGKYYDYIDTLTLENKEIHVRKALPHEEKKRMALDLAQVSLVFDEDLGVVYEGYTHEAALTVCVVKYYTDMDLCAYDTEESWSSLIDALESHGLMDSLYDLVREDLHKVLGIYDKIRDAATLTFERKHSLSYRAGKAFGSLLTDEDITTTLAKAEGVNSTMIDLLGTFRQRQSSQSVAGGINLLKFNKREPDKW